METYTIYVLDEGDLTIDGAVLDGVSQGDGSHMEGATLTINAPNWTPIEIRDNTGDREFRDNDGSQRLNGAQEIDGILYNDGTRVEAEYGMTLSDGVNSWEVVAFNVRNSSPAYGTVEGLAFIGGPGGFPPVGTELEVVEAREFPAYQVAEYATPICFTPGTRIMTGDGERAIETLTPGDLVHTRDAGLQPVRWIGFTTVDGRGDFAPVRVAAGALGNRRSLSLSPQHRVLLTDWRASLLFGTEEVLVPVRHLINDSTIRRVPQARVRYMHLLCDGHQIVFAEGMAAESLFPGDVAQGAIGTEGQAELARLFPDLSAKFPATARRCLKGYEAILLAEI
ncbi:MAG: Hint domain-containing protein [Pseudomonadota bacterium]